MQNGQKLGMYKANEWTLIFSNDSSDYSDWQGNSGTLQPPKRTSQRKIKRRQFSTSTEEEIESADEQKSSPITMPTPETSTGGGRDKVVRRNRTRRKMSEVVWYYEAWDFPVFLNLYSFEQILWYFKPKKFNNFDISEQCLSAPQL